MTRDSTSLPTAPQAAPVAAVAGQRVGPDRAMLPVRSPAPAESATPAFIAVDCIAVLVAGALLDGTQRDVALMVQLTALTLLLNAHAHLYRAGFVPAVLDELPALAARVAVVWCAAGPLVAIGSSAPAPGPALLFGCFGIQLTLVCGLRAVVHGHRRRAARSRPRPALVVGGSSSTHRLCAMLTQHPEYGLLPVGTVTTRQSVPQQPDEVPTLPVLSSPEDVTRAVVQNGVRDVLVLPHENAPDHMDLVTLLHPYGCTVWLLGSHRADAPSMARMSRHVWGYAYRQLEPPAGGRRVPAAKRALDLVGAGLMLLLALPVLLVSAAAVRISDGPGVLFRQERVGMHGRLFVLLKFRTLRPADHRESDTTWSVAHDERVSQVGRFLRRSSLDELPQLWNVLRGDMSLVGPRPERPYFVSQFSRTYPRYAARHRMVVGLTGLAQVHGLRGDTSIEDRCRFDNHYIDQWSWWQDVCILLRTALSLIRPAGS
ncbi:exopolysaccharide biosynthesis polyprenyl glycosylphosphotransferase [Streptomyces beijiangensis]|uniref:Exopolysaccharide biosynthesis polyprenyl glycosylphosphotransferase n=1 Tax=Streptomyces beijiangensis TaxID=163361 RepID=A0A939FBI3_9ACTN|nr:exopolysaccharide biosynthesis polyprenyl glycosylphosphotransferase [Streptomyces beijiangensis]MBO0514422.1 exopolysaccharide biosynthesis polyprenyl glycosylphosphotransferase [Streptomyces beijiangensis]